MGCGIAQLCAQRGLQVRLYDSLAASLAGAKTRIAKSLEHAVFKGRIPAPEAAEALGRISCAAGLPELKDAQAVIEAITEDVRLKQRLFKELALLSEDSLLATNTSSLPVWSLAQVSAHPGRVVGMHFFNPPAAMKLIEIVRTEQTQEMYFKAAWDFALALGKCPVEAKDTPGFIVNRVMRPYYLRALRLANEGVPIAAVDKALRDRARVPMGPFELMDLIGLDVNLSITNVIYKALGRPERLRPSTIQEWLVNAGSTGRKAGKGFYSYKIATAVCENPEVLAILPEPVFALPEAIFRRVIGGVVEEAQLAYDEGVATKEAIDTAIKLAMNFPQGPFEWQNELRNAPKPA